MIDKVVFSSKSVKSADALFDPGGGERKIEMDNCLRKMKIQSFLATGVANQYPRIIVFHKLFCRAFLCLEPDIFAFCKKATRFSGTEHRQQVFVNGSAVLVVEQKTTIFGGLRGNSLSIRRRKSLR